MKKTMAVLAMLVLFFGCIDDVVSPEEAKVNSMEAFNRSINGYFSMIKDTDSYSATLYNEVNNKSSEVNITKNGEDYQVVLTSDIYAWILRNVNGTKYLCLQFNGKTECTATIGDQTATVARNLESALFTDQYADLMSMKYNSLLKHNSIGMINFTETEDSYLFEINYSLKDLTGEELSRIFISPTSTAMTINNFREKMEFRKSDNLRTRNELIYNLLGSDNDEISGIKDFSYAKSEIRAPENVNESLFSMQIGTFSEFWSKYSVAKTEEEYKQIAIEYKMPDLCRKSSKLLECIDAYTAMTKDAKGCDYLNATEKDTCYYNFGTIDDAKYCESIVNGTMKQDCLGKGKTVANETAAANTTANKTITNETVKDYIVYS